MIDHRVDPILMLKPAGAVVSSPASVLKVSVVDQALAWGVPRVPGYTGRASSVNGLEASDFFCCVAFLSADGIAPKAVSSGVTQVAQFVHLQACLDQLRPLAGVWHSAAATAEQTSRSGGRIRCC